MKLAIEYNRIIKYNDPSSNMAYEFTEDHDGYLTVTAQDFQSKACKEKPYRVEVPQDLLREVLKTFKAAKESI